MAGRTGVVEERAHRARKNRSRIDSRAPREIFKRDPPASMLAPGCYGPPYNLKVPALTALPRYSRPGPNTSSKTPAAIGNSFDSHDRGTIPRTGPIYGAGAAGCGRLAGGACRTRPLLRMVVRARVGDWQAVDEVLQEVSLPPRVAQKAPLADASKVAPWLYRLAVRQVLLYRESMDGGATSSIASPATRNRRKPIGARSDPLQWLLADERGQQVRAGARHDGAARCGNSITEVCRRMELPRYRQPSRDQHSAVEAPAASCATTTARRPDRGET